MSVIDLIKGQLAKVTPEQAKTLERMKRMTLNNERIREASKQLKIPPKHR